jgi:predicted component of type VI protein secretion system
MPARLVAIDEGPDILLNRPMVVVGRHPACDTRLDSLCVSRHHCCMTLENGVVVVRDLGSTNGIRINGHRVEFGRLRSGDELSIAHFRYRWEDGREGERDHDCFNTPPPVAPYSPPREPVNPWLWVRPSAWGLGPLSPG